MSPTEPDAVPAPPAARADPALDPAAAVARYIAVAGRLPTAAFPARSVHRAHLGELVDEFDCFVLDGFGVLNVGEQAVPGAAARVEALRAAGCAVRVLTNGASFPVTRTRAKYERWGMHFAAADVVSSRDALARHLAGDAARLWGFAALAGSEIERLAPRAVRLGDDPADYARAEGFVLLGTTDWTAARQARLREALLERPRPVLVGNPDLVAPHVAGFSREPGLYAHELADALAARAGGQGGGQGRGQGGDQGGDQGGSVGGEEIGHGAAAAGAAGSETGAAARSAAALAMPRFFGKPFANAFELVAETLDGVDPRRVAMVGDSPHTDILGGAAYGWRTVLVSGHGLLKTLDVEAVIARSGIRPDFIVPTT